MPMPIKAKMMASSGVELLKCEVVPRAACTTMPAISRTIVGPTIQRTMARTLDDGTSGMYHASVQRKIATDARNFIGLIQGLMPRISR